MGFVTALDGTHTFLPAVSGNHNDLYQLVELLDELVERLKKSGVFCRWTVLKCLL